MDDMRIHQPGASGIVARAKAIITKPATEWPIIATETTPPMKVLVGYAIPLALIGPVATLIGQSVFGMPALFGTVTLGLGTLLTLAVTSFVMALVSLFVVAFAANFLSPKFDGRNDFPAAFRLVAYAMTASWVAGIFGLVPALAILSLLGLYSLYLFYKGATPMMGVPAEKAGFYTVITVVVAIVINIIASVIVGAITAPALMASGAFGGAAGGDQVNVDLGDLGTMQIDGENQTIDMGAMGNVKVDGNTATVTVDGQTITINTQTGQPVE
jgi:hypothetical protein